MEERAGEGGEIGTYRNLPSSVVVQGAGGQLGRNCSRCGQVACWFARPSGAHLGVLQSAKAPAFVSEKSTAFSAIPLPHGGLTYLG